MKQPAKMSKSGQKKRGFDMARPKGSRNKPKLPPPIAAPIAAPVADDPQPTPISVPPAAWSVDNWRANPGLQIQLQQLLDTPILRMAFQSLLVTGLPSSRAGVVPGVTAD